MTNPSRRPRRGPQNAPQRAHPLRRQRRNRPNQAATPGSRPRHRPLHAPRTARRGAREARKRLRAPLVASLLAPRAAAYPQSDPFSRARQGGPLFNRRRWSTFRPALTAGADDDSRTRRCRSCRELPMTAAAPRLALTRLDSRAARGATDAWPPPEARGRPTTARGHRGSLDLDVDHAHGRSPGRFIPAVTIGIRWGGKSVSSGRARGSGRNGGGNSPDAAIGR